MKKNRQRELRQGAAIVAFFFLLLPGGFLAFFGWMVRNDIRANTVYRETTCRVEAKKLVERHSQNTQDSAITYYPTITYRYTVDGREHRSDILDIWGGSRLTESGARSILARYEVRKTYPCWYDPADPTQAVLIRELNPKYFWSLIPVAALLVGITVSASILCQLRGIRRAVSPDMTRQ